MAALQIVVNRARTRLVPVSDSCLFDAPPTQSIVSPPFITPHPPPLPPPFKPHSSIETMSATTTTTTANEEASPSTTKRPHCTTTTDAAPAVIRGRIHKVVVVDDGGGEEEDFASPRWPPAKRKREAAEAAPVVVVDERTRLKNWTERVMGRIEAGDYSEGYAGFVRWVRDEYKGAAGLAGGELVAERAAVEAWLMIEWDRRLVRWLRDDTLGINAASFGVWDDDDQEEEKEKITEGSSKSN